VKIRAFSPNEPNEGLLFPPNEPNEGLLFPPNEPNEGLLFPPNKPGIIINVNYKRKPSVTVA